MEATCITKQTRGNRQLIIFKMTTSKSAMFNAKGVSKRKTEIALVNGYYSGSKVQVQSRVLDDIL